MYELLFKGYDLRGIYGTDQLNDLIAFKIGWAFGTWLNKKGFDDIPFYLGRDCRLSSPALFKNFTDGLVKAGVVVTDLGVVPTPVVYFACSQKQSNGCVITASHNPKEHNGFKLIVNSKPMQQDEMRELKQVAESEKFFESDSKGRVLKNNEISLDYINALAKKVLMKTVVSVVIDACNGVTGPAMLELLKRSGVVVKKALFIDMDGNFPNHPPDPHRDENLKQLMQSVVQEKADFGIAIDGDGDRLVIVDDGGRSVIGDKTAALFARSLRKGDVMVYDIRMSLALVEAVTAIGAKPVISKSGRLHVRNEMDKQNAVFGCELSGHYFFEDINRWDDALFAALKFCEVASMLQKSISIEVNEIPSYPATPEIRLKCDESKKFQIVADAVKELGKTPGYKLLTIDGLHLSNNNSWCLLRAANTGAEITMRFEGKSKAEVERLYSLVSRFLEKQGLKLPVLNEVLRL